VAAAGSVRMGVGMGHGVGIIPAEPPGIGMASGEDSAWAVGFGV
jgi:hypothetical protein